MEKPISALLVGAEGRLGKAITEAARSDARLTIGARCSRGDVMSASVGQNQVVIDVSSAQAAEEICAVCVEYRRPLVIGTTGHSAAQMAMIESAAETIPIVLAPNFSVGVNTLFWLTRKAAELLGDDFEVEIVEAHHRLKKDAPSGTAKRLAEIISAARELPGEAHITYGRQGIVGERLPQQIGMHAIRAGDIVGEHMVMFAGPGERLELTHRATSRDTFAAGALRAAHWIVGQSPRLYQMEHVLGLEGAT